MSPTEERDLHRHLDDAIGRALVDHDYADQLLARPQAELGTQDAADSYTMLRKLAQNSLSRYWPTPLRTLTHWHSRQG